MAKEEIQSVQNVTEALDTLPADQKLAMYIYDSEQNRALKFDLEIKNRWWYPFYQYAQTRVKSDLRDESPWEKPEFKSYLQRARRILKHVDFETAINIYNDITLKNEREPEF